MRCLGQSKKKSHTFADLRTEILLLHLQLDLEPEDGGHRHDADHGRGGVAKTLTEDPDSGRGVPVRRFPAASVPDESVRSPEFPVRSG